jgi:hypothetical protein
MPYVIKKTDGNIVATVTDGTVDSSSTSLKLIGKNFKGIGEIYNSNLVHLLENFSNSSPPNNQIKGQLWFNSNTSKLNVFDGTNWRPVGSPFVGTSRPANLVEGDLWIDNASQQLKFFDGSNLVTAGPIYTSSQGKTGWIVEEIIDTRGNSRVVAVMYVSNVKMAILNPSAFVPLIAISGFTTGIEELKAGLSFSTSVVDNNINAPSQSATALIDPVDGNLISTKFVRSDKNSSIDGSLTLTSLDGLIISATDTGVALYIEPESGNYHTYLTNNGVNNKLTIQTRTSNGFQNSLMIDPINKSINIYPNDTWNTLPGDTPQLNVNGDVTIEGNLLVVGETQFTNSTTLQITDKNIELAVVSTPSDTTADGAGLTVYGATTKLLRWMKSGITVTVSPLVTLPAWEVNDNFKIPSTNSLYIGNNQVLSSTTLGSNVVNSSLTNVGHLSDLQAAEFTFTDNEITVDPASNLVITLGTGRIIELTTRARIANVDAPSLQFDAANKEYVDDVKTSLNYVTVDTTGLATPATDAIAQIDALIPALSVNVGDVVRALCLSYTNGSTTPTVTRVVRIYQCDLVIGTRTWVYQTGQDIAV